MALEIRHGSAGKVDMVPRKSHDREVFYKYRSVEGALEILGKLHVCCTSPRLFNDPFDTLIELRLGFDPAMAPRLMWERIQQIDQGTIQYDCPDTTLLGWMINQLKANPVKGRPAIRWEDVSQNFNPAEAKRVADSILQDSNKIWFEFIENERIFCMSEVPDEILMWSHYADQHRGAVVEFKCVPTLDTTFNVASRVTYSSVKPTFGTFEEWFDHASGRKEIDPMEMSKVYSFTKSLHWQYEREWRFALKKKAASSDLFEYRDILPQELNAIYLGCRMPDADKERIIGLVKKFLAHMHVYQSHPDQTEYKLQFERIL